MHFGADAGHRWGGNVVAGGDPLLKWKAKEEAVSDLQAEVEIEEADSDPQADDEDGYDDEAEDDYQYDGYEDNYECESGYESGYEGEDDWESEFLEQRPKVRAALLNFPEAAKLEPRELDAAVERILEQAKPENASLQGSAVECRHPSDLGPE
ncbi:hypothetical protein ZWY2020_002806 [Hordeum vulgare]|nr:hypothetical protein ZWY2020_002806 [Hordeum vulgare]